MDTLSEDILIHVLFPFVPLLSLIALQLTSKRNSRLASSILSRVSKNHLKILGDVCSIGSVPLLNWFVGRGPAELKWAFTTAGLEKLIGKGNKNFKDFKHDWYLLDSSWRLIWFISDKKWQRAASGSVSVAECRDGRLSWIAVPYAATRENSSSTVPLCERDLGGRERLYRIDSQGLQVWAYRDGRLAPFERTTRWSRRYACGRHRSGDRSGPACPIEVAGATSGSVRFRLTRIAYACACACVFVSLCMCLCAYAFKISIFL